MKLKRNLAVIFACYYIMICVGLTLTVHFCGGMLASVSTMTQVEVYESASDPEACCIEKAEINEDCCNDAIIDLSEVKDDSLSSVFDASKQFIPLTSTLKTLIFTASVRENKTALPNYTFQSNAPPLYKLYSTYILYA
ncbi:MAG: HYC_CC_PP family protein [Flavobacteriaceae bacterium]